MGLCAVGSSFGTVERNFVGGDVFLLHVLLRVFYCYSSCLQRFCPVLIEGKEK